MILVHARALARMQIARESNPSVVYGKQDAVPADSIDAEDWFCVPYVEESQTDVAVEDCGCGGVLDDLGQDSIRDA